MAIGDINSEEKMFIGFTGFAQTGKDEATKILVENLGFERVSLADKVRQGIYNINPYVLIYPNEPNYDTLNKKFIDVLSGNLVLRLQPIVDYIGWDEAKKIKEVRRLLQYYGTEGARYIFGDTIWMDTADKYIENKNINKVAVSDIRFPNELEWIRSKPNNLIIKIKRKGVGPVNSHSSDLGIEDNLCDIVINNDGTLEDLRKELLNRWNVKMKNVTE